MEKILQTLNGFSAAIIENKLLTQKSGLSLSTIEGIKSAGFPIIPAAVPGNTELDMIAAGMIDFDPFFGENIFKMQDYEALHTVYFTRFDDPGVPASLCFEGIDTVADIYLNGELVKSVENMYLAVEIPLFGLKKSGNELVVHIKPAMIEARKYELPAICTACENYTYASLAIRKAAHMYGWDIMPRIVSSGIWKPVYLKERKENLISDAFLYTLGIDLENGTANLAATVSLRLSEDKTQDYRLVLHGVCGDSEFSRSMTVYASFVNLRTVIKNCRFWWPRYAGNPDLYDVDITLYYKDEPVDVKKLRIGVRTVELVRTDTTDKAGSGDFCFLVNGKRIFAMGSNWVPLDAFHSRDAARLDKAFELLYDVGSNVVRCWGGNVYENDRFYDLCDEHGVMVWQDFAMGCSVYPPEDRFFELLKEEAVFTIKRLRNHPALVLWAGDNEGDYAYMQWSGMLRNPDKNLVTRKVLAELCEAHDFTRPYLPSSPYITSETMRTGAPTSEDHLWGPRDYFKGEFYNHSVCHFASETGYHACPSPSSVRKFIPEDDLWPWYESGKDGALHPRVSWLAHAACMEPYDGAPYSYRIKLMSDQVVTLFGHEPETLEDFAKQSQISQGEAMKYFIERFRLSKPRRSGIIWWNIIDGWPQFSDAVVDYYYTKKLAYHYIKRAQAPVCLMFDEPQNNVLTLHAVNELPQDVWFSYRVTCVTDGKEVLSGASCAFADASVKIAHLPIEPDEKKFYLIEWTRKDSGETLKNHYFTNLIDIDYAEYMRCLAVCGFDQFEGFSK